MEPFQSGFRFGHTETGLVRVTNDLLASAETSACSILVLLHISAALYTISHIILLDGLRVMLGVSGVAFEWLNPI